jgi:SAM-dependent methyltransferase
MPVNNTISAEQFQKAHYDKIAAAYEAHYDDACSQQYRDKFFHQPMFTDLQLSGAQVLDAMCGNGSTTRYLLSQGAQVTGLDISPENISSYRNCWPACQTVCESIFASGLPADSFDVIAIVGGLHHLHPHLETAISELQRILKPGGYLCFVEPHRGSLPDFIRQIWYRHDPLFASGEAAIDLTSLKTAFAAHFQFKQEIYQGNLAYLFVLNSMVLRIPIWLKPLYTPLLLRLEALLNKLQGACSSCFVVSQWQKRVAPGQTDSQ